MPAATHRTTSPVSQLKRSSGLPTAVLGRLTSSTEPLLMVRSPELSMSETISLKRAWKSAQACAMLRSMSKSSMSATVLTSFRART